MSRRLPLLLDTLGQIFIFLAILYIVFMSEIKSKENIYVFLLMLFCYPMFIWQLINSLLAYFLYEHRLRYAFLKFSGYFVGLALLPTIAMIAFYILYAIIPGSFLDNAVISIGSWYSIFLRWQFYSMPFCLIVFNIWYIDLTIKEWKQQTIGML